MKCLSIRIDNLFSIRQASVKLNDRHLCLVSGHSWDEGSSNGAGKSSLINKSLIWALFGETPGGMKGDDVVNRWMGKDECSGVTLDLEVGGILYLIIRTRYPKAELKLLRAADDLDLSHRDVKSTQELINSLIGRDLNSFLYTDFFGQGLDTPFLSLTPKDQRDIVESVLPFEKLSVWEENAKKATKLVKDELATQQRARLELKAKLSTIDTHLTNLYNQAKVWESGVAREKTNLHKEIEGLGKYDSNDLPVLMDQLKYMTDFPSLTSTLDRWDSIISEYTKEMTQYSTRMEVYDVEASQLQGQLASANPVCPTCGGPWEHAVKSLETKINAIKDSKAGFVVRNLIADTNLEGAIEQRSFVEKAIVERENLETRIVELQHLEAKRTSLKDKLDKLVNQPSPYEEIIEATTRESENLKVNLKLTESRASKLEAELKTLESLERAFGVEVKNLLFEQVCPYLEDRVQTHLTGLNNSQLRVNFSTAKELKSGKVRDEFNITVQSASGGSNYEALSGGERQMVNFAIGLALSDLANTQVSTRSNLLILDEPFMALDHKNSEAIVNYLSSDAFKHKDSIFIISNEQYLQSLIPNNIRVEKRHGCTQVVS